MSKLFCETKIVSLLIINTKNVSLARQCLDNLSIYTKECYVCLYNSDENVNSFISNYIDNSLGFIKKVIEINDKNEKINKGKIRESAVEMLSDVKPDIVLFFDAEEIPPFNLWEQLRLFWEDKDKKTFWTNICYLWGDKDHYRNDDKFKNIYRVRAFKYENGIKYDPYLGLSCPTNFYKLPKNSRYYSNLPTLNYKYINKKVKKNMVINKIDNDIIY